MRCKGHGTRRESGAATAELAACLPVLVLIVAVAISAVTVSSARVRAQDAAREAARAAARGDVAAASSLAQSSAAGALVELARTGELVTARVHLTVHPLASWLPSVTVSEQAIALDERAHPP